MPLDPAKVLFFLFLLEFTLAVYGEQIVLDPDIDVLLVNSRNFNLQRDIVLVLVHVHRRRKSRRGECLFVIAVGVAEQTVHAVLQSAEFAEWVPASKNCHDNAPESEVLIYEFVSFAIC